MSHRKTKVTLPLAVILGFTPLIAKGINDFKVGGFAGLRNTVSAVVPYDIDNRRISFANLNWGLWPILAGFLVHKLIGGGLGVNRALSRMGIPWVRV